MSSVRSLHLFGVDEEEFQVVMETVETDEHTLLFFTGSVVVDGTINADLIVAKNRPIFKNTD